jgi:hypothetical protein
VVGEQMMAPQGEAHDGGRGTKVAHRKSNRPQHCSLRYQLPYRCRSIAGLTGFLAMIQCRDGHQSAAGYPLPHLYGHFGLAP